MNKNIKYIIIIPIALFLSILQTCDFDHGLEPIRSNIHGTINFSGEWPAAAAEVRLVTATQFPPSGIEDLIIGEQIPLSGDSYEYNFYLKPGTYKLVGVAWREVGSLWDIISICGIYFSGYDSLSPGEIVIPSDTSQINNIDIVVNRSRAHRITNSKITGSVTFKGTWPDSVLDVRVIATTKFSIFPVYQLPTLLDISFSNGIAQGMDSAQYVINAFPGNYEATAVLLFRENTSFSLENIIALDQTPYTVPEDSTVKGPDFEINFGQ
ncbi:hypothetical protein B6I21_05600 [candidate division KSB1 bacterium 4572_119]|nr:MAG: hypothetical protein B6I21_05600 [candidate division KSB1 bacterium 4572_119]